MPCSYPPRREPRILAIVPCRGGIAWVVVDPWEIRGAGTARTQSRQATVRRLMRREKPSALVTSAASLHRILARGGGRMDPTLLAPRSPNIPPEIARDLYPEFDLYATTPSVRLAASLAITTCIYAPIPTRSYPLRRCRALRPAA